MRAPTSAFARASASSSATTAIPARCGARATPECATAHLSSATHTDPDALDRAISDTLEQANVDLVVLVGYMKRLGPLTLARFANRMINTHPSLLPKYGGSGFFGRRVHEAVLANGDTESGATVHWVAGDYDSGPIIAQVRVPVAADGNAGIARTQSESCGTPTADRHTALVGRSASAHLHRLIEHDNIKRESFACASRHCSVIRTA